MSTERASAESEEVPSCTSCGACCFSYNERYLRVAGYDYERLGEEAEHLTQFIENRAYMRLQDGHCIALRIEPDTREFLCSIYERRPDVCRWLEWGSGNCRAERNEKAERPLVALRKKLDSR